MNLNNLLSIAIAIIYFALVNKALSVYYNIEQIDNMCKNVKYDFTEYTNKNNEYDNCYKTQTALIDEIKKQQLIPLMSIIISSLIISGLLYKFNSVLSIGLGIGSIFILINTIISNWYRFNDKHKLFVYSTSFIALIAFTLVYFQLL